MSKDEREPEPERERETQGLNFVPFLDTDLVTPNIRSCYTRRIKKLSFTDSSTSKVEMLYKCNYECDNNNNSSISEEGPIGDSVSAENSHHNIRRSLILGTEETQLSTEIVQPKFNRIERYGQALINKLLTPEKKQKLAIIKYSLEKNVYYQWLMNIFAYICAFFTVVFSFIVAILCSFSSWNFGFWKITFVLRNLSRRLLWWLTLAKCGDVTLFTLILIACPFLFVIAAIGLCLSLYCVLKQKISDLTGFLTDRT